MEMPNQPLKTIASQILVNDTPSQILPCGTRCTSMRQLPDHGTSMTTLKSMLIAVEPALGDRQLARVIKASPLELLTVKSLTHYCVRKQQEGPVRRRSAVEVEASDMQAAPARYVSANELYSTDEVELLLEEIRELEPTSCRGEDVQDFEIAGSGCAGAGGRSPAGTELTEHSWDSHAHYSRAPPPRPRALAPVYCHLSYLITPAGALTLILVVCSFIVCVCLWGALGLRLAPAAKPLLFGALTTFMVHMLRLLMHISLLDALLPVDWNRIGGFSFTWSACWLLGGALALLLALPAPTPASAAANMLYTAAGVGLNGACVSLVGLALAVRAGCVRRGRRSSARSGSSLRAAYRAVPAAPQPSTSRDHAL